MSKKEFFEQVKNDYEHWRDGIYKRKKGADGLSKHAEYLKWDKLHNEVEAYSKNKDHIGAFDPVTKEIYKKAVLGRGLEV